MSVMVRVFYGETGAKRVVGTIRVPSLPRVGDMVMLPDELFERAGRPHGLSLVRGVLHLWDTDASPLYEIFLEETDIRKVGTWKDDEL